MVLPRLLVAAAFLALPFAGCLTDDPSGPAATSPSNLPALPPLANGTHVSGRNLTALDPVVADLFAKAEPAVRYTGFNTFEPTLGVTPKGTIFMSRSASTVRSLDGGVTWKEIVPFPHRIDNDPYVYVDTVTGRVFVNANQAATCTVLSFSDDEGETWTTNPAACPLPPNDHQTMVTAVPRATPMPTGYPTIFYMCTNALATTNCARSLDGGLTFMPLPPAFVLVKDGCNASLGHLAASADGILYLPKGNCDVPTVFVSKDDGLTWTQHEIASPVGVWGHEVRVAVDAGGNVYAFWQGEDGLPYLARSTDEGATWSAPRMVGFAGLAGMDFPAIAAGDAGKVAFAYVGTTFPAPYEQPIQSGATPQLAVPATNPGMNWHGYVGILTDALDDNSTILTFTAGDPADPIVRNSACGRTRCPGVGDFLAIQIDAAGRPWAAFADACVKECAGPNGSENTYQGTGGVRGDGFVATLATGPALRGGNATLAPLPPPAATRDAARGGDAGLGGLAPLPKIG